jgi:peptidoglycan hydrolase-like protein with peptidoglycan-binding domain
MESNAHSRLRASKLKIFLLAGLLALTLLTALSVSQDASAATSPRGASASGGGLNLTETASRPQLAPRLGARVLREGMTGPDVRVLKGIVRSKSLLVGSGVSTKFDSPTTSAVRRFQKKTKIAASGVVNRNTARRLIGSMRSSGASWYGPGFFGNRTACGQTLRPTTRGVAHKTLPCGSRVLIGYRGRFVITTVIDRGPFVGGRSWDLTAATARSLRFDSAGVGDVRHAVISRR